MYIIIVGAGNIGYYLAKRLREDNHTVVLIERNKKICEEAAANLDLLVIHGDGCNSRFLEEAGADRADVTAAVTGQDDDNLVICQLAKEKFKVSRTVARVNDPANEHMFSKLGVDVPIHATAIIAKIIEEEVSLTDIVSLLTFKAGKLALVRVDLTADSPVVNKQVKEINLPPDSVLVSIVRQDQVIVPTGSTVLEARDDLIAITRIENEKQLLECLIGKI